MNLESCAFALNKCLVNEKKSSSKKEMFVLFRISSLWA